MNREKIIALAKEKGAEVSSAREALDYLATKYLAGDKDSIALFRAALREELLADQLLGKELPSLEGEFSGAGDSGDYYIETGDKAVDMLLEWTCQTNIHWDWYNGDGGGGDITWNLHEDKMILNGYYNETVAHDVAVEEEY